MQTPVWKGRTRYGLCLCEYTKYINDESYNGEAKPLVGHAGSAQGLKSIMIWSPVDGWGIVAMTNGFALNHNKDIRRALANAIYNACIKR